MFENSRNIQTMLRNFFLLLLVLLVLIPMVGIEILKSLYPANNFVIPFAWAVIICLSFVVFIRCKNEMLIILRNMNNEKIAHVNKLEGFSKSVIECMDRDSVKSFVEEMINTHLVNNYLDFPKNFIDLLCSSNPMFYEVMVEELSRERMGLSELHGVFVSHDVEANLGCLARVSRCKDLAEGGLRMLEEWKNEKRSAPIPA